MARKSRNHHAHVLPSKQIIARVGQASVIIFLVALLVMGRAGNPLILSIQMRISEFISPMLSVTAAPMQAIHNISSGISSWVLAHQQNENLKFENAQLLKWQTLAKDMQAENEQLREMLGVVPRGKAHMITAQILSDHGSAFSSGALIRAGADDGVEKGQAVIAERGLLGRVMQVGSTHSNVLLITDISSRIPVMNERTREKMILIGKGSQRLTLGYVSSDSQSRKGDRLITSGDGGVLPKNMTVGLIDEVGSSGIYVMPFASLSNTEYVSVVKYE